MAGNGKKTGTMRMESLDAESAEKGESRMTPEEIEAAKALSEEKEFQQSIAESHFFDDLAKKFRKLPKVVALAAALWAASARSAFGAEAPAQEAGIQQQASPEVMQTRKSINFLLEKVKPATYVGEDMEVKGWIDQYNENIQLAKILADKYSDVLSNPDGFYLIDSDGSIIAREGTETVYDKYNLKMLKKDLRTMMSEDMQFALNDPTYAEALMLISGNEEINKTLKAMIEAAESEKRYNGRGSQYAMTK